MRKNSLDLIMARLSICADTSITIAFFVLCTEKIRKLHRPFFVIISAWFFAWQWSSGLLLEPSNIWLLEMVDSLVVV